MEINLLTAEAKIGRSGFCFHVPDRAAANDLIRAEFNSLAKIAFTGGFEYSQVRHPKARYPVKIYAHQYKEEILMPQSLMIKDCELPFELQRYVMAMGEATTPQGLVKIGKNGNNKQILLTENNRIVSPNCDTLLGATRDRYWDAEDLNRFTIEWKRNLRDDGSNWFEYQYSTHDIDQPGVNLQRKHNRYRLVLDLRGNPYHICESLD